ncbi:MAG: glycosyltransferase family 2 protein [Nitrososphaera sp.]|nr:glycosyltransferase family 2 protein [Nitrososphaera sp.]
MTRIEIIIPMAGEGRRFQEAGHTVPKPFIDVHGRPMIARVIENLRPISDCFTLICRARDVERLEKLIETMNMNIRCIPVPGLTQGSVCTVLTARDKIAHEVPVMIANADQLVEYDPEAWWEHVREKPRGHSVWLFGPASHPKWSYARVLDGKIVEVAEKNPAISSLATVGLYFWKRWDQYCRAADEMIAKDIRTNGEFYNCPVYNEAIKRGELVKPFYPLRMIGLGTPEDLEDYLKS